MRECVRACVSVFAFRRIIDRHRKFGIQSLIRFNLMLLEIYTYTYCLAVMILKWKVRNGKNRIMVLLRLRRQNTRAHTSTPTYSAYIHVDKTEERERTFCIPCIHTMRMDIIYVLFQTGRLSSHR